MSDTNMVFTEGLSLHTGEVEGSIPSVPTIETLVNQGFSTNRPSDDLTQTDGTLREHDATGRGASVEVCSSDVLDIPTEPKAFRRWYHEVSADWPVDLKNAAARVAMSMDTKETGAWEQSYALRKAGLADWSAFTTALAAYRATEAV